MKKILLLGILGSFLCFTGISQNLDPSDVPAQVRKFFSTQYPKVVKESWTKDKGNYVVGFTVDETRYSVIYDKEGTFIEKDAAIRAADLPKPVKESIRKELPDAIISSIMKVENAEKRILYHLIIKKGNESLEIIYTPEGEFLSKKAIDVPKEEKTGKSKNASVKTTDDKGKAVKGTETKTQDKKPKETKPAETKSK